MRWLSVLCVGGLDASQTTNVNGWITVPPTKGTACRVAGAALMIRRMTIRLATPDTLGFAIGLEGAGGGFDVWSLSRGAPIVAAKMDVTAHRSDG